MSWAPVQFNNDPDKILVLRLCLALILIVLTIDLQSKVISNNNIHLESLGPICKLKTNRDNSYIFVKDFRRKIK